MIVVQRKCMGTACTVKAYHDDKAVVDRIVAKGLAEVDRLEDLLSGWRETSEISRINAAAGKAAVPVSPETLEVVKKGLWIAERTGGAFDITIGVFRGVWKFGDDSDGSVPDEKQVRKLVKLVGWRDVIVDDQARTVRLKRRGMKLDVEGIAKGYAVDAAVKVIRGEGLSDFIFQAGGDLFAAGRPGTRDWRVGVQDPRGKRGAIIYEVSLSDRAFNTSGDYERSVIKDGTRYHHILDARTGLPSRASRAVTILARDAFTADTLDTAVFTMGPEAGMALVEQLDEVEAVIVDADNKVHISAGLAGKLVKRGTPTPGI
jgi:thiamine biosynthesis lipoprotein